jgi:hypothetical protein
MYSGRVPLWSVRTLLVCFRRDRANHSVRYDRHRTQKEGAECTHVPGSNSGSLRGLYTSYLHYLRTDDERSGDRNAAHRRISRCDEFDRRSDRRRMFLTTCRGRSLYYVWWHQSDFFDRLWFVLALCPMVSDYQQATKTPFLMTSYFQS